MRSVIIILCRIFNYNNFSPSCVNIFVPSCWNWYCSLLADVKIKRYRVQRNISYIFAFMEKPVRPISINSSIANINSSIQRQRKFSLCMSFKQLCLLSMRITISISERLSIACILSIGLNSPFLPNYQLQTSVRYT